MRKLKMNFWKPQVKRAKLIINNIKMHKKMNNPGIVLDFGSAGMIRDDKMNLHDYLKKTFKDKGRIIGVDIRHSENTDMIQDLDEEFNIPDSSVDNIVAGEVIEHLKHPYKFLLECLRILKPKGRLIITTPSAEGIQLLLGKESPWHYYIWTLKNFKLLTEKAGFKIIKGERINIYYNRNLVLRSLGYIIPKLRPTLFFVLEK